MMIRTLLVATLAVLVFMSSVQAAEKKLYARKSMGILHQINFADRTAIIGGYRYRFGSYGSRDESDVNMLGYQSGSFEMLQPGMKVRVLYSDTGIDRYVIRLDQLDPSIDIYDRETRNEVLHSF